MLKKLILIAGPTAVGKTALSLQLAERYGAEIISADSRQIFRELTIGTAKPSADELKKVKHHFIDSHSISEQYDAAKYGDEALTKIHELFRRHEFVIMCGGSGLYIQAALEGFDDIPAIPEATREFIQSQYEREGLGWLQGELSRLDPGQMSKLDIQNPARVMRALEVKMATGISISFFQTSQKRQHEFQIVKIGLACDREELYRRIDERMDQMIERGLFQEAESLVKYKSHQALQTVGYQEVFGYLEGKYDKDEAIRLLKRNSRRYAKRQLTWFNKDREMTWFSATEKEAIIERIDHA